MTGRGRRPSLPVVHPTNRLLAQFALLKNTANANWEDVMCWYKTVLPEHHVTKGQLEYWCQKCLQQASDLGSHESEQRCFLDTPVAFDVLPSSLSNLGLSRTILLNNPDEFRLNDVISVHNLVVVDLISFQVKEGLPSTFVYKWVKTLGALDLSESKIRHKVSSIQKMYSKLKRVKGGTLDRFLNEESFTAVRPPTIANPPTPTATLTPVPTSSKKDMTLIKKLQTQLEFAHKEIETLKLKENLLKDERNELQQKIVDSSMKDQRISSLMKEKKELTDTVEELQEEINDIKSSKAYKRNHYLTQEVDRLKKEGENTKIKFENLKCDKKEMEKVNSDLKRELDRLTICKCVLEEQMVTLLNDKETLATTEAKLRVRLRSEQNLKWRWKKKCEEERAVSSSLIDTVYEKEDEENNLREGLHNKFKQKVRLAYMSLQGEVDIPAIKCSKVVAIVSKHLFGKNYGEDDLPSTSTALKIADEGHHVAKQHIVQAIKDSQHFTLGTDGTSRQKQHFIERHLVLNDGKVMSLGFSTVAVDDANTLLQQTMDIFHELTEISLDCNKNDLLREILTKMKCLMSDRAATMKLFDKKMAAYKKQVLGEEDNSCSTHFLFCNAHFLLGLSKAAEEAVEETEDTFKRETQSPLGRDKSKSFLRFSGSTENAACRLIRMSADVFGPRGDEQSGCRSEWLAYCDEIGVTSKFTSFRGNRFNNLFENSSALIFHHHHIQVFLEQFVSHSNLKLQSILADLQDKTVLSIVGALAVFNLVVTGPYWKLMNSNVSYGSFSAYVKLLRRALHNFADDNTMLADCLSSVFTDFIMEDNSTALFVDSLSCRMDVITLAFHKIAEKSIAVLERQLEDFIEGGIFGDEVEEEVQKILDSCPLTNLVGERLFGDLDYDMGKRRHSTIHHRSTLNMWKHNKTGKWLGHMKPSELESVLLAASKHGRKLREKHREADRMVKEKVKERIRENDKQRKEKDIKLKSIKASILDSIICQGGPCRSREEVDQLFQKGRPTAQDLKAQLQYRKVILGEKDVKISGSVSKMYSNLVQAIEGESSETLCPPNKRPRIDNDTDNTSSESDTEYYC